MLRTQVSLGEDERRLLDEEAARSGLSMSELVRRAVTATYGGMRSAELDLARLQRSAGAWDRHDDVDGEAYVEQLRSGRRLDDLRR